MPFNSAGVYTPPTGAENAAPGDVIRSATWNSIFTDLSTALSSLGVLFPTGVTPGVMLTSITGVDFNAANTDHAIPIILPVGFTRFRLQGLIISHASHTLVTATFGLFSQVGGGGAAILAAGQAITVSSSAENTVNNAELVGGSGVTSYLPSGFTPANTIQFRVGTAEGAAATADVAVYYFPLP